MNAVTMAGLLDTRHQTIARIEAGAQPRSPVAKQYLELRRLWEAYSEVVDPSVLPDWFNRPNEELGGQKPIDLVKQGDTERLWTIVDRLRHGIPG